MCGAPVTSGLAAKRGSCVASSTTSIPSCATAWLQKAIERGVSTTSRPQRDLNHWRFSSTSEISAIGTPKVRAARRVKRSKRGSAGVSSTSSESSMARRVCSEVLMGWCMATPVIRKENGEVKAGRYPAPGAGAADEQILSRVLHGNYFCVDTL
jgi:hypothetical protein